MSGSQIDGRVRTWMEQLARTLDLPASKYEAAERSYRAISNWLERKESRFSASNFHVYTQGSFRLGTAIAPVQPDADYDLDVVCEFDWSKVHKTQCDLHTTLGLELIEYAERYGMERPGSWDRCWTLNYAEGARFHIDILPCVADGRRQRELREAASIGLGYVENSISITDRTHRHFNVISHDWPVSNPNGYADWFYQQMRHVFDARREYMMLVEAKADVSDIPEFRVRTPLQLAIQILKRHRDLRFTEQDSAYRPTSIVITTLAARSYDQQASVFEALQAALERMEGLIDLRQGRPWISNPADPRENFADAWADEPRYRAVFSEWLEDARSDFKNAIASTSQDQFVDAWSPRLGRTLVEDAFPTGRSIAQDTWSKTWRRLRDAPHRAPLSWPSFQSGHVKMSSVEYLQKGFRPKPISSNSEVPRNADLTFQAQTDVPRPFEVFWQIINTGEAARLAKKLRGRFEPAKPSDGHLTRHETAAYRGIHSIECFIVKNGYCVARSGMFVINIK